MVLASDGYLRPSEAVTLERRQLVVSYVGSQHLALITGSSVNEVGGLKHAPSKMGTTRSSWPTRRGSGRTFGRFCRRSPRAEGISSRRCQPAALKA